MSDTASADVNQLLHTWDQGAWCLAALALDGRDDAPLQLRAAAYGVLAALGLVDAVDGGLAGVEPALLAKVGAQAAAPLHFTSALLAGREIAWDANDEDGLRAQGEASAQGAIMFARFMVPAMGDLGARLSAPGARMLDVGTGVAALAVAYAEVFPNLQVLGIDVLDRPLELARETIAASSAGQRVAVRKQSVADFADADGFDLAWIPAPFIPAPVLHAGLARMAAALRPGGWLVIGHGKFGADPVADALNNLKTLAYGGTPVDETTAQQLLRDQGLTDIQTLPTPLGAPGITIGRAPTST
jgi:SAM-dependent methyltransferase